MSSTAKLAAAAVIVLAIGGSALLLQQTNLPAAGTPTSVPSPVPTASPTSDVGGASYQDARATACGRFRAVLSANTDLVGLYDPGVVGERRTTLNERQRTIAAAIAVLADELGTIEAPPDLAVQHAMDVARQEDLAALFRVQTDLLEAGRIVEAGSVEQSFEALGALRSSFERENGLPTCS
jgi:hypothetical protein